MIRFADKSANFTADDPAPYVWREIEIPENKVENLIPTGDRSRNGFRLGFLLVLCSFQWHLHLDCCYNLDLVIAALSQNQ